MHAPSQAVHDDIRVEDAAAYADSFSRHHLVRSRAVRRETSDLVFQPELPLFQFGNPQRAHCGRFLQLVHRFAERLVLLAQFHQMRRDCHSFILLVGCHHCGKHYPTANYRLPSSASFTSLSASLFCARGTCVRVTCGKLATRKL